MGTDPLRLGYFKQAAGGSTTMFAFAGWLPIHHRHGIGRPTWLLFAAPAGDVTAALEGAAFVMQRPAGKWNRIPPDLPGQFGEQLRDVVQRLWFKARATMN